MIAGHFAPTAALWRRDLLRTLRKRRSGVFLGVYAGLLAMMILANWPSLNMTPYMVQSSAESTLFIFTMLSYGWIVMIMPPYGAAAITQERERETMEMLSMTLVPPWGIVLGKWGAHAGLFLFVLLAAMPIIAASTFFTVGTDIETFTSLVGLVANTSITCIAIGVAFSSFLKSSKSAVIFTYVGVAMMLGLPIVLYAALVELVFNFNGEKILVYLSHYFTPIGATFHILEGSFEWFDYLGVQLYLSVISLLSFTFASWRFSRSSDAGAMIPRAEKRKVKNKTQKAARPVPPIGDRENAWYAREVMYGALTRGRMRWGVFGGGCVVFGLIALAFLLAHFEQGYSDGTEFVEAWVGVGLVAIAVVVPGIAANAFTSEFDGERMDLLRGTLLTPRDYVLGSLRSSLRSIMPLFMSILLTTLILSPIIAGNWKCYRAITTGFGTAVISILLATAIGVAAGTVTRRTATALMLAYASVFVAFIGAWLGVYTAGEMLAVILRRSDAYSFDDVPRLLALREIAAISSPIVAYFTNLDESPKTDLYSGYWVRSVALACAYTGAFALAALFAFRVRVMRDA